MRLIDADQMATDESEAYMNASLLVKDNVDSGINYIVHKKIQKLIADTPTVDPMKHGHWVIADLDGYDIECSNCHNEGPYGMDAEDVLEIPYCPWCGAKMDDEVM